MNALQTEPKLIPLWLTADEALLNELRRQLHAGGLPVAYRLGVSSASLKTALEALLDGAMPAGAAETAILASFVRPCVPFAKDTASRFWQRRLTLAERDLAYASHAVARIAVSGHDGLRWAGMGWLVADGVLVTTRIIGQRLHDPVLERTVQAEAQFEGSVRAKVDRVLLDPETELAFLTLQGDGPLPPPVLLCPAPLAEPYLAAIGYPGEDSRAHGRVPASAYGEIFDRLTVAPGRIYASGVLLHHDCATLGNSTGALLLDLDSGKAAGLHLGGFLEGTAASATTIRDAMQRQSLQPAETQAVESVEEEDYLEAISLTPEDYVDRTGYDVNFLGATVPLPKPVGTFRDDVVSYTGPDGDKTDSLPYTHFSVVLSKSRKLCLYAAVNIDGNQQKALRRAEKADHWAFDPRIDRSAQCGREVYRGGFLDLGHMVRRLDPVWGNDFERANDDTFHYTNACPQHKDLNRKVWNDLEDYVLKNTDANRLKVTVFTGPVLAESDPAYRGIKLPQEYWKVVVMVAADSGRLHATAYILSQADMITGLEFVFGEFRTYQLPLVEIEKMTQLDFGELRKFDPKSKESELESAGGRYTEISDPNDLVL